jgi:hypothetical protein
MDYWHMLYILPAVFSAAVIAANLLPFERSSRHNTLFIAMSALVVFNLPQEIQMSLALCLPVAYLHKFFGVSISGIEKMDYGIRKIPGIIKKVKDKLVPAKIKSFLTRAYPDPETEEPEEVEEVEEPKTFTKIRKFVPDL